MKLETFNEICELAYDVRTDHERQHGQWEKWYHTAWSNFPHWPSA